MKADVLRNVEGEILENKGYREEALLDYIRDHPRAAYMMRGMGLIQGVGDRTRFPEPVTPEEEKADQRAWLQGFQRRVGMHTTSVGMTYETALRSLGISDDGIWVGGETMTNHDLYKIQEILWRKQHGVDGAYNLAEERSAKFLLAAGYPPEYVKYAGSVGLSGAKEYIRSQGNWPNEQVAAFLSDELINETQIATDVGAKTRRLIHQSLGPEDRYYELNRTGFPDMAGDPRFTYPNGEMIPKFTLQRQVTMQTAGRLGEALGIRGDQLGKFLIRQAVNNGVYDARIS